MTITYDVQTLEPGEKVVLYELNSESIGGDILYFHGYQKTGSIWWQGKEYTPWAIQVDGFAKTGDGQQPTPTMQVGNIGLDAAGNPVPLLYGQLIVGSAVISGGIEATDQ